MRRTDQVYTQRCHFFKKWHLLTLGSQAARGNQRNTPRPSRLQAAPTNVVPALSIVPAARLVWSPALGPGVQTPAPRRGVPFQWPEP